MVGTLVIWFSHLNIINRLIKKHKKKDWEDRKLGNYLTSETRFEEIIETVCSETDVFSLKFNIFNSY